MDANGTRVDHDARAEGAAGPRIPSPPGAGSRFVGPAAVVAAAVGYAALWLAERPPGQPVARFLGEACGAEAILLLSCSLVLIALVPYGERWFGGFDRIVVWHRGAADRGRAAPRAASRAGHLVARPERDRLRSRARRRRAPRPARADALAFAPRLRAARSPWPVRALARTTYEHWLGAHRLTGLFVAVAVTHGAIVDPVLRHSAVLRAAFVLVGVAGIGAYVYREFVVPHVVPTYDYTVKSVRRLGERTAEIALDPGGERVAFRPGQFVVLTFAGSRPASVTPSRCRAAAARVSSM